MPEENVEIVREIWKAWDKDDPGQLPLSAIDPEAVYEDSLLPDHAGETYHGHQGFLRAWAQAIEPWAGLEASLDWARAAGDDVVSCHRMRGRGKESGIEMEITYGYVWKFRDGKIVYCKAFATPDEALEAAGLSE
jgi:ketosteroid isomerase-like protein